MARIGGGRWRTLRDGVKASRVPGGGPRRAVGGSRSGWPVRTLALEGRWLKVWPEEVGDLLDGGRGLPEMVAGPAGAAAMVGAMAAALGGVDSVVVREAGSDYRDGDRLVGACPGEPGRVAMVDGVAATGGTLLRTAGALRCRWPQAEIEAAVVLDLQEGATTVLAEEGIVLRAVLGRRDVEG